MAHDKHFKRLKTDYDPNLQTPADPGQCPNPHYNLTHLISTHFLEQGMWGRMFYPEVRWRRVPATGCTHTKRGLALFQVPDVGLWQSRLALPFSQVIFHWGD